MDVVTQEPVERHPYNPTTTVIMDNTKNKHHDDEDFELAPGPGKDLYDFLEKYHIYTLMKIPSFLNAVLSIGFILAQILTDCLTGKTTLKLFEFILSFIIHLKETTYDCKNRGCCNCCSCTCCPCLECEDCGCRKFFCLDMIRCYFFTCSECKNCSFCNVRNCFYCEIVNPFMNFKAILYSILYLVYQVIGRALAQKFKDEMGKDELSRECEEKLSTWTDVMFIISIFVVIKIIIQLLLGVYIFYGQYKAKRAQS